MVSLSNINETKPTSYSNIHKRKIEGRGISRESLISNKKMINNESHSIFTKKKLQNNIGVGENNIDSARDLIFFVTHGLEANPFDMRHVRAAILTNIPMATVVMMNNNYTRTNDNIVDQGYRFSIEVRNFMMKISNPGKYLNFYIRYSFYFYHNILENAEIVMVGHSLGGLIIREGLKYLAEFKNNMTLYLSLNTPHLGCISPKFLVKTGKFIFLKFVIVKV